MRELSKICLPTELQWEMILISSLMNVRHLVKVGTANLCLLSHMNFFISNETRDRVSFLV